MATTINTTMRIDKDSAIRQGSGNKADLVIEVAFSSYVFINFKDMIAIAMAEAALAEIKKELLK